MLVNHRRVHRLKRVSQLAGCSFALEGRHGVVQSTLVRGVRKEAVNHPRRCLVRGGLVLAIDAAPALECCRAFAFQKPARRPQAARRKVSNARARDQRGGHSRDRAIACEQHLHALERRPRHRQSGNRRNRVGVRQWEPRREIERERRHHVADLLRGFRVEIAQHTVKNDALRGLDEVVASLVLVLYRLAADAGPRRLTTVLSQF